MKPTKQKAIKSSQKEHAPATSLAGWESIDWKTAHKKVRLLQDRIVKATTQGKHRKAKALQWILTHSFYAKAIAVKRVTENKGKNTAGIDRIIWKSPADKWKPIQSLSTKRYKASPLRRVLIPKANGKNRKLAIPTFKDRAMQALLLMGLDPIAETWADTNSYGFRKARSCADAIEQCFTVLDREVAPQWILDADIEGCFDNISHQWLIDHIPINKRILKQWIKADIVFKKTTFKSKKGTPQGGIIPPVLANMALDSLESRICQVAMIKFDKRGYRRKKPMGVHFVRYADDFIITAKCKNFLQQNILPIAQDFLAARGLKLSNSKSKIIHISKGFDFLGSNIRKHRGKLIIKPSKAAMKNIRKKIHDIIRRNKSATQNQIILKINSVLRGWANFHRHTCAKRTFTKIDNDVF